ncbi:hypothetical protein DL89DRAFT_91727 [Linderina pennispora]|uniref:Uncharacterized protein n=1 Tax=Linderina pennispora TaxID=61395 RepID=A0A1Y1WIG0_9FUNG|nr:uncharacterized protein DL89DRAFT_91727 [Linderina pennispora]ORX73361.1 hypothetical protein DL89DRAFT_91727 [Linderina pennispora]
MCRLCACPPLTLHRLCPCTSPTLCMPGVYNARPGNSATSSYILSFSGPSLVAARKICGSFYFAAASTPAQVQCPSFSASPGAVDLQSQMDNRMHRILVCFICAELRFASAPPWMCLKKPSVYVFAQANPPSARLLWGEKRIPSALLTGRLVRVSAFARGSGQTLMHVTGIVITRPAILGHSWLWTTERGGSKSSNYSSLSLDCGQALVLRTPA